MKKIKKATQGQWVFRIIILTIFTTILSISGIFAQEYSSLTGKVIDKSSNQGLPFANIILYSASDSKMVDGVNSDTSGIFNFRRVLAGNYTIQVSMLGYGKISKKITVENRKQNNAGTMFLQENAENLSEVVVVGDRLKGKSETENNTYYTTKRMKDASATGMDILKLLPGVQVDMQQNISLEGSQKIMILVDGRERDKNYISQINPQNVDKVEIMSAPPSKYDADVTGVINIILKKEKNTGISGQINVEIPTSTSMIYDHPSYNFSLALKCLNIFTSYNGEMIYGDVHEFTTRTFTGNSGFSETRSDQYLRQKCWSHRFDYGFDYFCGQKDQISFYAFYNPYSRTLNGSAEAQTSSDTDVLWKAQRNNTNINTGTYYSLYYKHSFNDKGNEISCDITNYHLKAENTTTYAIDGPENSTGTILSSSKPTQNALSIKIDCNISSGKGLNFNMGGKLKMQSMQDLTRSDFHYKEMVTAVYGALGSTRPKFNWTAGLRLENSVSELAGSFHNSVLSLLPYAVMNVKFFSHQSIKISLSRTVRRPGIYQLNPSTTLDDPFTISMGNPSLHPEFRTTIFIEYSKGFKSNYLSARLFYNRADDVINNLTLLNDTNAFETRFYNLGTIHQYGVQLTGSLNIGKRITFTPYFRLFDQYTAGNSLAQQYAIEDRDQLVFESGFSAIFSFKYDMTLAVNFQYNSPKNNIQDNYFSGALYFITFEKAFKKNLKVAIESGLPLTKTFTYDGSEINGPDFHSYYRGDMHIPDLLVMFKLSYSFDSGKKQAKINHSREEIDTYPRKGL